jgi:DNA repair exonuclease SbcCD nuclease subunit
VKYEYLLAIHSIEKMRVLFIGDVHIKHTNLKELSVLMEALSLIDNVDIIVVAGDVLDTHEKIDSQLLNRAYALIRLLRDIAPTYVLVGNHDYINNQQFLTTNHWMNGMKEWKNVIVVDEPVLWDVFAFVPYVYPGRFVEALDRIEWKRARCVFAHQELFGCKMGAITSTIGDEWHESWPTVISGHIHERQSPQPNVIYPGSVLNHAFGYESQGLSIFTFRDDDIGEERIPLQIAVKKTIHISTKSQIRFKDLIPSNRFSVAGTESEIASFKKSLKYKEMKAQNVKVVFKLTETPIALNTDNQHGLFASILASLVARENDIEIERDYKTILE